MSDSVQQLLSHPAVQAAVANVNTGLEERRAYQPPRCAAFTRRYTRLTPCDQYVFDIDREARRLLPSIIHRRVEAVSGVDALPAEARAAYERPRRIGIVFSGGPAPGGHNVIAGLYDAA
ncbi:MAG: phosphofructokinase, partial [Desulfobacteraceae bacterium]|nr:phosphofructokinase [Desulfobacteraceae bacterium]